MNKIIQHYRNGRNWGDSWYFITKMMLTGNLLTDEKYKDYLKVSIAYCKDCITPDELDAMSDFHQVAMLYDCEDSHFTCVKCCDVVTGESNE